MEPICKVGDLLIWPRRDKWDTPEFSETKELGFVVESTAPDKEHPLFVLYEVVWFIWGSGSGSARRRYHKGPYSSKDIEDMYYVISQGE